MIRILPLKDETKKRERLASVPTLGGHGEILSMQDGREEIGWAAVNLQASVLRIYRMHLSGQTLSALDSEGKSNVDSLMRAAASYGANFGAYRIEIYEPELLDFFCAKGFTKQDGCAAAPMTLIIKVKKA
ncbi:MAG: hypothetical protein HFJ84_05825 [Clostridiales bacterium]|jgi:hypothetical protein|nr:hypothetical protein [Clostridiales bacterium]